MKKLTLFVAFALTTGFAMSQNNNAVVSQDGASNKAIVNQAGQENNANVEQFGRNDADVNQLGTLNNAIIKEGTTEAHRNNYSTGPGKYNGGAQINQVGDENFAQTEIYQSNNGTLIDQLGNENIATQLIETYLSRNAFNNPRQAVEIIQVGNSNVAAQTTAVSFGSHGIQAMWIDQNGIGNYADQNSVGGRSSKMIIDQLGDGNISVQNQNQMYGGANAMIIGNGNTTLQDQTYSVWDVSGRNDAKIDILGDNNFAAQAQLGEYNLTTTTVIGDGNISLTNQLGDYNEATINQTGDFNTANINQMGLGHNGLINQIGDNNNAMIFQSN